MARRSERLTGADVDRMIEQATHLLVEAAHPEKIILFGSYARGDFTKDSDLDLLVILPTVQDRFSEMVRLQRVLLPLSVPVDVLVYSTDEVRERGHLRGTTLYHALLQGRILYFKQQRCTTDPAKARSTCLPIKARTSTLW